MKPKCLICNSSQWHTYCSIEKSKYRVIMCKKCTFTQLFPLPSQDELNHFYAKVYRKQYSKQYYVSDEVLENEQQRANRVIGFVKEYFNTNYKQILDIGNIKDKRVYQKNYTK